MNLEFVKQSEASQKDKNKHYILMHIHGLFKWDLGVYVQGRNREADIEKRLVDTAG